MSICWCPDTRTLSWDTVLSVLCWETSWTCFEQTRVLYEVQRRVRRIRDLVSLWSRAGAYEIKTPFGLEEFDLGQSFRMWSKTLFLFYVLANLPPTTGPYSQVKEQSGYGGKTEGGNKKQKASARHWKPNQVICIQGPGVSGYRYIVLDRLYIVFTNLYSRYACHARTLRRERRENAFRNEILMKPIILREFRMEGRKQMVSLTESNDGSRITRVGVILIKWDNSLWGRE